MALSEPIAVYNAANVEEAQRVRDMLKKAGLLACVTGELPQQANSDGTGPQVFVDRKQVDRAGDLLSQYEEQVLLQENRRSASAPADAAPVEVVCDECGQVTRFGPDLRGTVQSCVHCNAFVDVGAVDDVDFGEAEPSEPSES
jgi:hypothetical protein